MGSDAGMRIITSDDDTDAQVPWHDCGLARDAAVGNYIFGLYVTSLAFLFPLVEGSLLFVAPMILMTVLGSPVVGDQLLRAQEAQPKALHE